MKWFIIIGLVFVASACTSYDTLTYQNMERAWEVRDEDKRPVVSDEEFNKIAEEEGQGYADMFYIPQSLDDAREFEKEQALAYERSKE